MNEERDTQPLSQEVARARYAEELAKESALQRPGIDSTVEETVAMLIANRAVIQGLAVVVLAEPNVGIYDPPTGEVVWGKSELVVNDTVTKHEMIRKLREMADRLERSSKEDSSRGSSSLGDLLMRLKQGQPRG